MLAVETSLKDQMISLVDKQKLENTLIQISAERFSGRVDLEWHLNRWALNKQHLFKLLGNKLKVEQEVECVLSRSAMLEIYREFSREHLEDERKFSIALYFLSTLDISEIASNSLVNSRQVFDTEFKPGAKVSRILGKLVNKNYAHDIQTKYSMFLQKLKSKGKAVISIDPVDYLTMSENKSGWRSCHALDGEYRTGTLAYMVDESTMIAYVKTSEDVVINDKCLPYSNKTWRQIVLVDKFLNLSIQGRQYPAEMPNNATTVSNMLVQLFGNAKGAEYTYATKRCGVLDRLIHDEDYEDDRLWYNDFSAEAFNTGNVVHKSDVDVDYYFDIENDDPIKIYLGSNVRCVESSNWLYSSAYLSYHNYSSGQDEEEDDWDNDHDNDEDNDDDYYGHD